MGRITTPTYLRTPEFLTNEIRDLCREVDSSQRPVYVSVKPEAGCSLGECLENVQRKVETSGGGLQHGWNIRIWPMVLLDAQFHVVYVNPPGTYLDITPTENEVNRILFLPDTLRVFSDERVHNRRIALNDDPDVQEYIALTHDKDQIGEYDPVRSRVGFTAPEMQRRDQIQERRATLFNILMFRYAVATGPCPCGSGQKFKHCCRGK